MKNNHMLHPDVGPGPLFGGMPGPTKYYFNLKTFIDCEGDRRKLWSLLQQKTEQRKKTYLPAIRQYKQIVEEVEVLTSYANTNPQYGIGGGEAIYIANYKEVLVPVRHYQDLSKIEPPSTGFKGCNEF